MLLSGHQVPRQRESAPQVSSSDESLYPQGSQCDPIKELNDSLKRARLPSQHAIHSPATSGESSPCYKDFLPQTPEGRDSFPPQGSSAVEQSQLHHQEGKDCPLPSTVHHQPVDSLSPDMVLQLGSTDGRYCLWPDDAYCRHDEHDLNLHDYRYHSQYRVSLTTATHLHMAPDDRVCPLSDEVYGHHSDSHRQPAASY